MFGHWSWFFVSLMSKTLWKMGCSISSSMASRSGRTRLISRMKFANSASPQKSSTMRKPPLRRYFRMMGISSSVKRSAPTSTM